MRWSLTTLLCFANHAASEGGGIYLLNATSFDGHTKITNDAIYANTVTNDDGIGGGVFADAAVIANDTIAGSQATGANSFGGGVFVSSASAPVIDKFYGDTIADNLAASGGGMNRIGETANTIVAGNTGGNCGAADRGADGGHNLEDDPGYSCGFSAEQHDLVGVDPQVAPLLALNGGSTKTLALGTGSPAIGAGDCTLVDSAVGADVDQRDFQRHFATRGACDIGAYDTGGSVPQEISFTSSPPDHPVYGGSDTPATTGGGSGNPVVLSIDSSSDLGACSISGGTVSFTGVGSCVIDANQAGNENYRPADQAQQAVEIGKATLTVTADDQAKSFGDPVPPLTATIRGFANGETLHTSGVTGQAECTTAATAASPGGTYAITCTQGSLAAAHYVFGFDDGTLAVTFAATVTGSYGGQLNVARGRSALIGSGASISDPVTVQAGGALEIDGAHITGPLKFSGAAQIRVCNTTITGPTTVTGAGGLVTFGDGTVGCPGNRFTGPVRITNGTGGVIFDHNTITGPLTITGNTGTLPPPHTGTVEAMTNTATGKSVVQER